MQINIIKGPAAIRIGKYWVGAASGNRYSDKHRLTVRKAIFDARLIENGSARKGRAKQHRLTSRRWKRLKIILA